MAMNQTGRREHRAGLQRAREHRYDIAVAMGRMRIQENKPLLAGTLWPALEFKARAAEAGQAADVAPVHETVRTVCGMVGEPVRAALAPGADRQVMPNDICLSVLNFAEQQLAVAGDA